MAIVGFNFTKICIERFSPVKGKINISNNVSVVSVEKTDLSIGAGKEEALRFGFEFTSEYTPKVAQIDLQGEVLYMSEKKNIDKMLDQWKKEKSIPKDIMTNILNNVLNKCNIQALILSKDLNLPPPIPLPKVKEQA